MPLLKLKISGELGVSRDKLKKPGPLKKQHQNICFQQFEQFFTIYLHNLIEFIRPTFNYVKNRSKVTRFLTMWYTKYMAENLAFERQSVVLFDFQRTF